MKRNLFVLALLLLVPVLVLAQAETTGRISGTVKNADGTPAKDARVSVSSPALQGEREFTTDANGRFLAGLLPSGEYTVVITAPNMQPSVRTLRVGIGQTSPVEVTLLAGGTKEEVTVYGDLSKLATTANGENFNYDNQVNQLPITNRAPERVAELAPNVSFGPTPNTLTIAGAPSFDTVVLLDGSEVSDPYFGSAPALFLEEALDEVQVLTSGISARYGRFQGGVINATTKSGGNTFDGTARVDLAQESWNDKSPAGETQTDTLSQTYSATVMGPIIKDHLTFFVGGRKIKPTDTTGQTGFTVPTLDYVTTTEQERWQAKLTAAINPNNIFDLNYAKFDQTIDNGAGLPAADLRALALREDPRDTSSLEYQGVLSDTLFLNVLATRKRVSIENGGDPALGSPFLDFYGADIQIWHNHWWDFTDASDRDNDTASASLTKVLSTGDWGEHTLEFGAQYVNSKTAGENRQSPTGFNLLNYDAAVSGNLFSDLNPNDPRFNLISYSDPAVGFSYRWEALPLGGGQELKNTALYAQDTWQIGKFRFDAGLRWEQYEGEGPQPTLDLSFDAISPRLGVTYNVDQNWQLQATWGRYISRFNDNVASSVSGVGGAPYIVSLYTGPTQCTVGTHCMTYDDVETALRDDSNWGIILTITDPTQPTRFLADDIAAPHADEINLTAKRALPRNTGTFTISYVQRAFRGLLDDFVGGLGTVTVTDPKGSGASFDFDTTIWDNSDQAKRDYDALVATFDFRPSALWGLGGNYTYAHTRANYEGEGLNTPSSGSIIGNYPNSVNQEAAFPYGFSDDDIRHRARVWGTRNFDFGRAGSLVLGGIGTYQSGLPYNKTGGVNFDDDPTYLNDTGQYTYFTGGRGNNRFSGWWRLDASLRYSFNIVKDFNAYVKVDVLNVTNNDELIAFNTSGTVVDNGNGVLVFQPGGSFGEARNKNDYQLPRSYFLAFGLEF